MQKNIVIFYFFIFFNLFACHTVFANFFLFDSRYSTFKLNSGSTFAINSPLLNYDGTLIRDCDAIITGSSITFETGIFENCGNQLLLSAVFDPDGSLLLSGDQNIRAAHGQILQEITVSGINNLLQGSPRFIQEITFQDMNTSLSVAVQSNVNKNIVLNGGTLILDDDLRFSNDAIVTVSGIIKGNGYGLETGQTNFTWNANLLWKDNSHLWLRACKVDMPNTFTFQGNTSIDGHGNILDIRSGGSIIVDPDSTLFLSDLTLKGLGAGGGDLIFRSDNSEVQMSNVTVEMVGSYTQTQGSILIKGPTTWIIKDNSWTFDQSASLTVDGVVLFKEQAGANTIGDIYFGVPEQNYLTLVNSGTIKVAGLAESISLGNIPQMIDMLKTSTGDNADMIAMLKTSTGFLQEQIDNIMTVTDAEELRMMIDMLKTSTGELQTEIDTNTNMISMLKTSTGDNAVMITMLKTSTSDLQDQVDALGTATADLQSQIGGIPQMVDMLKVSTGQNAAMIDMLKTSTGENADMIAMLKTSTGFLQEQIDNIATATEIQNLIDMVNMLKTSTGENADMIAMLKTSTGFLQEQIDNIQTSTDLIDMINMLKTSTGELQIEIDNNTDMINMLKTSTGDMQMMIDMLKASTGFLQEEIDAIETMTGLVQTNTCTYVVSGEVTITPSLLPDEGEVVIFEFDPCYAPKGNIPKVILDPVVLGGDVPVPPNSRLVFSGSGIVELKDGLTFDLQGTPCDPDKVDWPELQLDNCAIMRPVSGATGTVRGSGCFTMKKGASVTVDQNDSRIIFGDDMMECIDFKAIFGSQLIVDNPTGLITFHQNTFDLLFDNHSGLSILDGTVEMNTDNGAESPGNIRQWCFTEGSSLQILKKSGKLGTLRLAPNKSNGNVDFDNETGEVFGNGNVQYVNFDGVDTILMLQPRTFNINAPMVSVFMNLTYLLDPKVVKSPEATILVQLGWANGQQEGRLAAFCPSRDGSVVPLNPGDHDVRYDRSKIGGSIDLIRGFDVYNRRFTIYDCDERTRETCP